MLNTREVAERLSLSKETVRRWLKIGKLSGVKIGGCWRVKEEALAQFLEEQEIERLRKLLKKSKRR